VLVTCFEQRHLTLAQGTGSPCRSVWAHGFVANGEEGEAPRAQAVRQGERGEIGGADGQGLLQYVVDELRRRFAGGDAPVDLREGRQALKLVANPLGHPVEGPRQGAELVPAIDRQRVPELPFADALDALHQGLQGREAATDLIQREQGDEQQGQQHHPQKDPHETAQPRQQILFGQRLQDAPPVSAEGTAEEEVPGLDDQSVRLRLKGRCGCPCADLRPPSGQVGVQAPVRAEQTQVLRSEHTDGAAQVEIVARAPEEVGRQQGDQFGTAAWSGGQLAHQGGDHEQQEYPDREPAAQKRGVEAHAAPLAQ
jgi:hypothetical protein